MPVAPPARLPTRCPRACPGATCHASDLPKLRAYPWDRVFPSGTSQRAIDLAHRLLCYDPAQRLTASQALAHPFFEGVQYLLQDAAAGGGAAGRLPAAHEAWQATLQSLFDTYVAARSAAVAEAMPALEKAIAAAVADTSSIDAMLSAAKRELAPRLAEIKRREAEAMSTLSQAVLRSVRAPEAAEGSRAAALAAAIAEEHKAAEGATAEIAALREQLAKLQEELHAARAASSGVGAAAARSSAAAELGSPSDRAAPSHRNSIARPASGSSPMYARASSISVDETPGRAAKGIRGLPADNMGQARTRPGVLIVDATPLSSILPCTRASGTR